jgi:hypothetical protein
LMLICAFFVAMVLEPVIDLSEDIC